MTAHDIRTYTPSAKERAMIDAQGAAKTAVLISRMDKMRRKGRNREGRNAIIGNVRRKLLNSIEHVNINAVGRSR